MSLGTTKMEINENEQRIHQYTILPLGELKIFCNPYLPFCILLETFNAKLSVATH